MSRIGKKPIALPGGVKVQIGEKLEVTGPKGKLAVSIPGGISVKQADGRHRAWVRLLKGVDRAFANAVARRRSIAPAKPRAVHRTRVAFKKFRYLVEQLRPLMPRAAGGSPGKLRGYQKLMGDIQDCETLLAALDKFMREEKSEARRLRKFRAAVKHDHTTLMARYLRRADELFAFWKPTAKPGTAKRTR